MDYLALIRRADFNDLFKYGKMTICGDFVANCSKSEKLTSLDSEPDFLQVFSISNNFDNTASYLIIQYQSLTRPQDVEIRNLKYIYALDDFAKKDFEISFDRRIKIEDPIFDINIILKQKEVSQCFRGIDNVWSVFGLSDEEKQRCKTTIPDSIVNEAVNVLYSDRSISGDLPFWVYLLRYERHSPYPKTTLGYFMDVVHTVCNFMKKETITNDNLIESRGIFKILSQIPITKQFKEINEILSSDQGAQTFINTISFDWLKTSVIFLLLRDRYAEGLKSEPDFIDKCKNLGSNNFCLASYLLGIYLGYDKTYDCLYDTIKLPIFKKEIPQNVPTSTEEYPQSRETLHTNAVQLPNYPFKMQKISKKSGKPSTAKGSAVIINNETDYNKYINDKKNVWKILANQNTLFSKK